MTAQAKKTIRVAVYSRKSTDHGLEKEFNSCDAQEQACGSYILANESSGWKQAEIYRDGGFSGGTTKRPAFQKMMTAIRNNEIDVVIVHRIDRLSRSLADFLQTIKVFEKHNVSFISVTQQIDTSTIMGKLILNILLSFAQFEREMISERTRDKIVAARKNGKFTGGRPVKGYNIHRSDAGSKLVVDPEEAEQIRTIFELYLEKQSLIQTAKELNKLGWTTKKWTTRKGTVQGGKRFDKKNLHGLLTNPVYIGKTRYGKEVFEGEHESIIDMATWKKAQELLIRNARSGGSAGNAPRQTVLLRNLLFCHHCGRPMRHTYTLKKNVKYRYYICDTVRLQGKDACVTKRIPADQIEQFVIEQIRGLSNDTQLLLQTLEQTQIANSGQRIDTQAVADAFRLFDPIWEALTADEQIRILNLIIERIEYDGTPNKQRISISYRPEAAHTLNHVKESA